MAQKGSKDFDIEVLKQKIASGRDHTLTVVSDSMIPLIAVGESITVGPVATLKVFDIVLFFQGARLNVHYLTRIDHEQGQYITRSLKNPHEQDYPLKRSDILGVIINKKLSIWHKIKILLLS